MDLDNTLWGGVIGDDGLDGIVIGQGDGLGEAYLEVQRAALALRERGIILAVCSKNTDEVAREPFRAHPDMLLKEEHIAVFQANWVDKPSNLVAIADALNIGIDSLVLLDDNPAERAQVREALPQVAVPELPEDPALYAWTLLNAGYFEAVAFSEEDRSRAEQYGSNARYAELAAAVQNIDEYHASLQMVVEFAWDDIGGRNRVTQLINKTNQFNLTTRRYSEAEVSSLMARPDASILHVRLRDRFGDHGVIAVVICRSRGNVWEIDSWLMSCRVLSRRIEEITLAEIVRVAREAGATTLAGYYIPTAKNGLVKDLYYRLGFLASEPHNNGDQLWLLDLSQYLPPEIPIRVAADI